MRRLIATLILLLAGMVFSQAALCAEADFKLASDTGSLLRGTLYKHSGIAREGIITIRTAWNLPAAPPVYRYDFDIMYGTIDSNHYSFLMADVAEMEFLPIEDAGQPVNIRLRNGVVHKVILSSEKKTLLLGPAKLNLKQVDVVTDDYGENIVSGGDVYRIVFSQPVPAGEKDMPGLVDDLGKALEVGERDGLVDDTFLTILENLQNKMKARLRYEIPKKD